MAVEKVAGYMPSNIMLKMLVRIGAKIVCGGCGVSDLDESIGIKNSAGNPSRPGDLCRWSRQSSSYTSFSVMGLLSVAACIISIAMGGGYRWSA